MENGVMMQRFEWNLPNDRTLWKRLRDDASRLREIGTSAVWISPAYKGHEQADEEYGTYDLHDLGELDQEGTMRTKYGTKQRLQGMTKGLHRNRIGVYLGAMISHKVGADYTERFMAQEADPGQWRNATSESHEIEGRTGFDFPRRGNMYSSFKWYRFCFSRTDYDVPHKKEGVFQILGEGKHWSEGVDDESGSYDYFMLADLDFDNPEVVREMQDQGIRVSSELNPDGMRFDTIKHVNDQFIKHFLEAVRVDRGEGLYAVGEYQKNGTESLGAYLSQVEYNVDLFDVVLHYNLNEASEKGHDYNLRDLLKGILVEICPSRTVTFVGNHDSQKSSSLELQVKDWSKPPAYGLILLMKKGYPRIFYGDYCDTKRRKSPHHKVLDILLRTQKEYAYGEEVNYFDRLNTIGFVRLEDLGHADSGLAVIISNGENGEETMSVGENREDEVWHETTGLIRDTVTIDKEGKGRFLVKGGELTVWVKAQRVLYLIPNCIFL